VGGENINIFSRKVAQGYDDWYETPLGKLVFQVEKDLALQLAQPSPGEQALDLGCGTGVHTLMLARQGLEVKGIDISPPMLEKAREKIRGKEIPAQFIQGSICDLPFPPESFDLVLGITVFEFLENPRAAAREAWRVLRPGGRMVIGVLGDRSPWTCFYQKLGREGDPVFQHARFFSPRDLLGLLPGVRGQYEIGLHFGPDFPAEEKDRALEIEKEGVRARKRNGGFICGLWRK